MSGISPPVARAYQASHEGNPTWVATSDCRTPLRTAPARRVILLGFLHASSTSSPFFLQWSYRNLTRSLYCSLLVASTRTAACMLLLPLYTITVTGIDKQRVGEFAANVRAKRKPEPYGGKGVRYKDEHIRRKEGKTAAAKK